MLKQNVFHFTPPISYFKKFILFLQQNPLLIPKNITPYIHFYHPSTLKDISQIQTRSNDYYHHHSTDSQQMFLMILTATRLTFLDKRKRNTIYLNEEHGRSIVGDNQPTGIDRQSIRSRDRTILSPDFCVFKPGASTPCLTS